MKIKSNLFLKSFILAFVIFSLISGVIIASLYIDMISIEPNTKESTILIGLTNQDRLVSLMVMNFIPQENRMYYVSIPDNTFTKDKDTVQESYKGSYESIKNDIENLIGTEIDRYFLMPIDALAKLTDEVGNFYFLIKTRFDDYSGLTSMNGESTKLMFEYKDYDMSKTSISDIAIDYFTSFMSKHGNNNSKEKLVNALTSTTMLEMVKTNMSKDEVNEYAILLSKYSDFSVNKVDLNGKIEATSSGLFFRPTNFTSKENIFK